MTAFSLVLLGAAPAVAAAGAAPAGAAVSASPANGPNESVIVMLKHQYSFPDTAAGTLQRVAGGEVTQAPSRR